MKINTSTSSINPNIPKTASGKRSKGIKIYIRNIMIRLKNIWRIKNRKPSPEKINDINLLNINGVSRILCHKLLG